MQPPKPLTLIVATTPLFPAGEETTRLGIGLKGTLPWPRIKTDMSFFARVTSRPPTAGKTNAIIMGRKTYDSVPASLRPLAKRISVVVSRDTSGSVKEGVLKELEKRREKIATKAAEAAAVSGKTENVEPVTDAIVESSLDGALRALESKADVGKVFVIGGAEIYNATLGLERGVRVVMTNVVRKDGEPFECDTFFPVDSFEGWRAASSEEVSEWVGEEVDGQWKDDGDVKVQMVGFEKV
ncbi:Dihydrofolate reductase [Penicillium soppii]|uniref:Dihydrofolate reductase n=1 Tax=Penicillium soppii TaxID=69789 RepID=UPI0025474C5F|nr:Dihydrofolate reductase [Penicillium soppii]KAJ5855508.1 Dihydrofolate reductase [Penicillium soppii]